MGTWTEVVVFLPDSPVRKRRFADAEKVAVLLRVKDSQRYVHSSSKMTWPGVPVHKTALLTASFMAGTFGAAFMLLLLRGMLRESSVAISCFSLHRRLRLIRRYSNTAGHTKKSNS